MLVSPGKVKFCRSLWIKRDIGDRKAECKEQACLVCHGLTLISGAWFLTCLTGVGQLLIPTAEPRFPPVENEAEIVLCSSICRESASLLLTETPFAGLPGWMRLSERIVGTTLGAGLALRKCSTPWQLYLQRGR